MDSTSMKYLTCVSLHASFLPLYTIKYGLQLVSQYLLQGQNKIQVNNVSPESGEFEKSFPKLQSYAIFVLFIFDL
jgi:hypothetical protein